MEGYSQIASTRSTCKSCKRIYRYDPDNTEFKDLEDFNAQQKNEIFKRDGYRCVVCGLGPADGIEIQADHIKPKELGGRAEIENGQTLCATHNFRKKHYKQTETGKKMFIRLYELAIAEGDDKLAEFCETILEQYETHGINDHIKWTPKLL